MKARRNHKWSKGEICALCGLRRRRIERPRCYTFGGAQGAVWVMEYARPGGAWVEATVPSCDRELDKGSVVTVPEKP